MNKCHKIVYFLNLKLYNRFIQKRNKHNLIVSDSGVADRIITVMFLIGKRIKLILSFFLIS